MFRLLGRRQVRLGDYTQPVDAANFTWGRNDEYCEPYVAEQLIKEATNRRKSSSSRESPSMDVDPGSSDYNRLNGNPSRSPDSPNKTKGIPFRDADGYDHASDWTRDNSQGSQPNYSTYEEPWDSKNKQKQLQNKLNRTLSEEPPVSVSQGQNDLRRFSHGQAGIRRRLPPTDMYEDAWDTAAKQKQLEEKLNIVSKVSPTRRSPTSPLPVPPAATYEEPWENRRRHLELENRLEQTHIRKSPNGVPISPTHKSPGRRPSNESYEDAWDLKAKAKPFGYLRSNSHQDREPAPLPPSPQSQSTGSPLHKASPRPSLTPCTIGERINPILPLHKQIWYHGRISRADAENMLRVCKEGSYLVRESESDKGQYSLSIKSAVMNIHLRITRHMGGMYILGENSPLFREIPEMIDHYTHNPVPLKGADHLTLLHPVEKH